MAPTDDHRKSHLFLAKRANRALDQDDNWLAQSGHRPRQPDAHRENEPIDRITSCGDIQAGIRRSLIWSPTTKRLGHFLEGLVFSAAFLLQDQVRARLADSQRALHDSFGSLDDRARFEGRPESSAFSPFRRASSTSAPTRAPTVEIQTDFARACSHGASDPGRLMTPSSRVRR